VTFGIFLNITVNVPLFVVPRKITKQFKVGVFENREMTEARQRKKEKQ